MLKWNKRVNRYICNPSYLLIVVDFAPGEFIDITLFAEGKPIRSKRTKITEVAIEREELDEMVKEFCTLFVAVKKLYSDKQIAQYARELRSVSNILGLKIWENKYKKKWGLKE
jgi:hypothetical protein